MGVANFLVPIGIRHQLLMRRKKSLRRCGLANMLAVLSWLSAVAIKRIGQLIPSYWV